MASNTLRRRATYRALGRHQKSRSHPFLRILIVLFVGFAMLTGGASAGTLFFYGQNLPSLGTFKHAFQFQNTLIRASKGQVLYNLADLSTGRGRRVVEPLQWRGKTTAQYRARKQTWLVDTRTPGIPAVLQDATIATEDASFYSNFGFDPFSIVRAGYDDLTKGHIVSGASTITQQLVRAYMLKPSPTLTRKTEEIILAAELTQKYPKSKILWYYLNSVPYGNLSVGAQAASETYFGVPVWKLDLAQSALLAGLPEAPSTYNPVTNKSLALERMRYVLHLMYIHGYLKDAQGHPDPTLINQAMQEAQKWKFAPPRTSKRYPQFVEYAIAQLQQIPQLQGKLYNGLDVYTSLDPQLQDRAQQIVKTQIDSLVGQNVTDGALVSLDLRPSCYGCIRAMVGSADYNSSTGQINMADSPRQPGSSFKPFNYIYAFQHGVSPGTSVLDGPIAIPDTGNPEDGGWYEPTDYDHTFHGVVTLRTALDNSLNVPAVRVEQYDASLNNGDVRVVANQAVKMGIKSFWSDNPNCCGWALTLGGMERGVRLVEETAAYGAFATEGMTVPPTAIVKVYDRSTHKLLYDAAKDGPKPVRAVPAAYAYIMDNVLSDNSSRCTPIVCEFGLDSPLYLGRTAAAKTGTTNSFTDNWTVGYTPDIVTGVWVGNADNSPMVDSTGVTGAAPIWHDFMLSAFDHYKLPPKDFVQPPGVYAGSECRLPGPYTSFSSMGYDIYAGVIPLCSVGEASSGYLPPQAQNSPYQAPTAVSQPQTAPAPVQPAPAVATPTPVPAAPPPTAAAAAPPVQAAPTQSIPGVQPGNVPPPTAVPPAQSPPAQSAPTQSAPSQTSPGSTPP